MTEVTSATANTEKTMAERLQMQIDLEAEGVRQLGPLPESLHERVQKVPLSADLSLDVKIIHPMTQSSAPRPMVVLFYGGGFMAGSYHQLTEPGRTFAEKFNAVVVLGSYRLVPSVRWPAPWQDGWKVLSYLSWHAHKAEWGTAELSAERGGGFVVGGISAGASIATVCAEVDALGLVGTQHEEDGIHPLAARITGLMANVPFLLVPELVPEDWLPEWTAWKDNENVEGLNTGAVKGVLSNIECTNYRSWWLSPIPELMRSQDRLERHPRVYVSVCQMDPLRDDGILFCKALKQRGVEIMLDVFPDDGHNGWTVRPLPRKSVNPTIEEGNLRGMQWLLSR